MVYSTVGAENACDVEGWGHAANPIRQLRGETLEQLRGAIFFEAMYKSNAPSIAVILPQNAAVWLLNNRVHILLLSTFQEPGTPE